MWNRFIAKACHGRDAEIHVAWTEEDYSLLEHYINKEKKAFPAKFIPDLGSILKGLFAEAQSRVATGPFPAKVIPDLVNILKELFAEAQRSYIATSGAMVLQLNKNHGQFD